MTPARPDRGGVLPLAACDLRAFFEGDWAFLRVLEDHELGLAGSLLGHAAFRPGAGGGLRVIDFAIVDVNNCVLWDNAPDEVDDFKGDPGTVSISHSDIQGGWDGDGNIDEDPLFVDPDNDDFRLSPNSPCIDAADNTAVPADVLDLDDDGDTSEPLPFDLGGAPRFVDDPATADCQWAPGTCGDPPIVDMGVSEFPCDMNCDGQIDAFDIEPFLDLLFGGGEPCAPCTGDVDGNGEINAFDIEPFLECLFP